jgi:predicted CXXCH cytochrome family protein
MGLASPHVVLAKGPNVVPAKEPTGAPHLARFSRDVGCHDTTPVSFRIYGQGTLRLAYPFGLWPTEILSRTSCPNTMRALLLVSAVTAMLLCAHLRLAAQDIDSIVTSASRTSATIADGIKDPAERSAFITISKTTDPQNLLALTRSFLEKYPRSAFLAQVSEGAARSSFDLGDLKSGMDYAKFSLSLLPENPLLLVAVADVQAVLHQDEAAMASARDALDYLDRFDRPLKISEQDWPDAKRKQQATAWFVIGRALVNEALQQPASANRTSLIEQAISALDRACTLKPGDMEIIYLLGVAHQSANDSSNAAIEFATVYRHNTELASQAREQLAAIYEAAKPKAQTSFEDFVSSLQNRTAPALPSPPAEAQISANKLPAYAGSQACGRCHVDIVRQWAQSGMSKMLRPYLAQNIIGDFEKKNEFYEGEDIVYRNGKVQITPHADPTLFARMVIRSGRHYFDIKESDGRWHSYPVDYTIGSKWQQAYATKLPNGQIHVFPIQYSTVEKKWLNYWKVIDAAGSERADPAQWERLDGSTSYELNCAVCHTSQLRNTLGKSFSPDNVVFREPGIGCEMCHGPSASHVEAMANGKFYPRKPLDPPVDFSRITNREFVTICAQCHMQSNVHRGSSQGELNYSSTGTFFLKNAALPLGEFTRGAFYKDGRFTQATFMVEALERSQCFRRGRASCGTCHDPHGHDESSNLTSLKFKDQPDLMCTGCHTQFQDNTQAAAHTHHSSASEASRCVSCHMPRIVDGMLLRVRSHQIDDIPNADMTMRFGQEESPNACLLCHSEKTPEWVQGQLRSWKTNP